MALCETRPLQERRAHVLQLHITERCNLRCVHCYQQDYGKQMTDEMFFSVLEKYDVFTRQKGLGPQINLTGGEPLLHPGFFAFCQEIRRREMRLGILTNGTLIDRETARSLALLKPVFVQISLDGTQKNHDAIRGTGNFNKAVKAIDLLKENGVKVLVSFTAQKQNYRDFKRLAAVCRKHRVDKLWWDRVVTGSAEDASLALSTKEFMSLQHCAARIAVQDRFLHRRPVVHNCRSLQFFGDPGACGYRCAAGRDLLVICPDGSVMPCRRLPFVIGNIGDGTVEEIIQKSPVMHELATAPLPDRCLHCREVTRCFGGAKCITFAQTGSFQRSDVNCPVIFKGEKS